MTYDIMIFSMKIDDSLFVEIVINITPCMNNDFYDKKKREMHIIRLFNIEKCNIDYPHNNLNNI